MRKNKIALPLILAVALTFSACGVDQVIAALQVADQVTKSAIPIVQPSNTAVSGVMTMVSSDLELVIKTYQDYESATPAEKPGKLALLQSTANAIQINLGGILDAISVKNPELRQYVAVAVAVVNSAVTVMLTKLPSAGAQARAAQVSTLPTVQGAKSAKDLKNAWNNAVKTSHPESKI